MADLQAVLSLAQHVPVFPCRRHAETITFRGKPVTRKPKSPLTEHGFENASRERGQIVAWHLTHPDCYWGVPTGSATGLVVIDYDTEKADDLAREWLTAHAAALLETKAHATVSGGRHYLFRSSDRYSSGVSVQLDGAKRTGIDIRAEGGYIVWWPLEGLSVTGEAIDLPPDLLVGRSIESRDLHPLPAASPESWRRDAIKVADALAFLDPEDYDSWIGTGMSIHAASGAGDEGFRLWAAWSSGEITGDSPRNFSGLDDLRYRWESFSVDKPRDKVRGLGSLFQAAKARGYVNGSGSASQPELPPIESYGEGPVEDDPDVSRGTSGAEPETKDDGRIVITLAGFTAEQLMGPIEPEKYLIPGMIPTEAYTLLAGALSAAKTTLLHCLMLWRATGYDILDIGGEKSLGVDTGPCVLVSYEDSDNRILRRFQRLAQHQHAAINLIHGKSAAAEYLARIEKNFRRVTLTGQHGAGIVYRHEGCILEHTSQVDAMLNAIGEYSSSGVMIGLDPLRLAIVGSQNDDDGADTVVHVLNRMANHFPDSGLIVPSHTTKSQAKGEGNGGMADASYATSGSALYSQHARSNFHLARLSSENMRQDFAFGTFTDDEITKQLATCLTHGRLSHGTESGQRFFAMRGGILEGVAKASGGQSLGDSAGPDLAAIREALERIRVAGMTPSKHALEGDGVLKGRMNRSRLRDFIKLAVDQGWIEESGTTKSNTIALTATGDNLADKSRRDT